ncbi:MAG: hypothetical protein AAGF20_11740 [Pseudomonadota bacterium]
MDFIAASARNATTAARVEDLCLVQGEYRSFEFFLRLNGLLKDDFGAATSCLTIPDSNNRVQTVVDGQGIALWDDLVAA